MTGRKCRNRSPWKMLKNDFNLSSLDDRSRTIISSLFPLPHEKGYEVKKEVFEPTKFKGI